MEYKQQFDEVIVENPSQYDAVMEASLFAPTIMDCKMSVSKAAGNQSDGQTDKMNSSVNSTLEDTTPSDSGVQMLDSECSEFMEASITSQTGLDFEDFRSVEQSKDQQLSLTPISQGNALPLNVDSNFNVTTPAVDNVAIEVPSTTTEDPMTTSVCSTFDTTENIVYRRKVRKTPPAQKQPKKRVSFHEDILKNTRTDNIHIEHGFITYKQGRKIMPEIYTAVGRYSWCSEREGVSGTNAKHAQLCDQSQEDGADDAESRRRRRIVYRNACSDVLDYGNSTIYDTNEDNCLQYDNSGVFEYIPVRDNNPATNDADGGEDGKLYRCSCSSSNSSLDSDENDKNSNPQQYPQAKSSSCDCIGASNNNNNFIDNNCYFSEPSKLNETIPKKSVWNKDKKPKSSCLKKTKRYTNIIPEHDLSTKVKKFNVHDVNQLLDNSSRMIFGSLKSIFTMTLPERGVPEGSEDLHSVIECVPEVEQTPEHKTNTQSNQQQHVFTAHSPIIKSKPFLSKSLDGSKKEQNVKNFVHNVDEQLRRKNEEQLYAPTRQSSAEQNQQTTQQQITEKGQPLKRQNEIEIDNNEVVGAMSSSPMLNSIISPSVSTITPPTASTTDLKKFRNKFIINCESTVFEHTGVSYCYEMANSFTGELDNDGASSDGMTNAATGFIQKDLPIGQPEKNQLRNSFMAAPITKTFTNFFRSFKEPTKSPLAAQNNKLSNTTTESVNPQKDLEQQNQLLEASLVEKMLKHIETGTDGSNIVSSSVPNNNGNMKPIQQGTQRNLPTTLSSSTLSEVSTSAAFSLPQQKSQASNVSSSSSNCLAIGQDLRGNLEKQSRHLPSPLKKRSSGGNLLPQRYGVPSSTPENNNLLSPDLFNSNYHGGRGSCGRDSKDTILSEEFDDILTITTDNDKNESDIVILDYPELNDRQPSATMLNSDYGMHLLKPPQPMAKASLINRFLRNVTQKKLLESSMRRNDFFADKLKNEQKLFSKNLYLPGAKPQSYDLIDDLNAEIAMEIEMSGAYSPRRELANIECDLPGDLSRFELGIGEISTDIFNGHNLHILRSPTEQLLKVFKLYTGYSREGFMTPVLVFLTDQALYVADLIRNRLCSKFILAYIDLDVILMGPYGNTVLLSNSTRDMQQVLLAGGPYPANGLVANLELCARRSGSVLPAVGQLTLEHLMPLRAFVSQNSCINISDPWMYYAVVNVPSSLLCIESEPLGPHVKGFLMHRRIKDHAITNTKQSWNPGYFLLKAGVLYMFQDSTHKIPSWAMALAECQGARRAVRTGRPHCFEVMLKEHLLLQLAAPDEYVASEWLQALLQSASGLFVMQEKHKTLGCSVVITQNHIITLREDFTMPLKQFMKSEVAVSDSKTLAQKIAEHNGPVGDGGNMVNSAMSTPTKGGNPHSCSSLNSTPTKMSQLSRSTTTGNTCATNSIGDSTPTNNMSNNGSKRQQVEQSKFTENYATMSSVYGWNSGVEILSCASIKDMTGMKIPSSNETWWCILEFSCQEVRETSDDLIIFFASSCEMQRFLRLLEQLWHSKNNDLFPINILDDDDIVAEQCTMLYMDINRSWEPLLSAALGYPL